MMYDMMVQTFNMKSSVCYILGYIKLTKPDQFYSVEICTIHYNQIYTFIFLVLPRIRRISH
jgi:hypothetical protein